MRKALNQNYLFPLLGILLIVFSNPCLSQLPSKGLVLYLPFNGNAKDMSTENNNGTVNGAVLATDRFGHSNAAYSFTGSSSYINCGKGSILQIKGDISMGGWLYMDGGTLNPRMLSFESTKGNYRIFTSGTSDAVRTITCSYGNCNVSTTLSTKQWHHILFTYTRRRTKLYIDGIKVKDTDQTLTETLSYTTSLNIGRKAASPFDNWGGKLDEIVIYNRALTDDEVTQVYNTNEFLPVSGLVAYYPFSNNAIDVSGNKHNGTINGATPTTDRFGNANRAYNFNGSSYITIPTADVLNLQGNFTISSWFYLKEYASTYNASMILSKHDGDSGNDGYVYGIWNPNHNSTSQIVNFQANDHWNTDTYPGAKGIVSTNKWYHFIVTYTKSTSSLKYYLNGQLILNKTIVFDVLPNSLGLTIGYSKSTSGTYADYFNGVIDDIRIYNSVLNFSEVQALYHEGGYASAVSALASADVHNTKLESQSLSIYPNPSNNIIHVSHDKLNTPAQANIINAAGTVIKQFMVEAGTATTTINIDALTTGLYYIQITDSKKVLKVAKFIKN